MYLKKLICINWGNLPIREYDFGSMTLLTGGSGSGKTTMADAIQTVMTAAKRGLFMYNPGQDEATQYGRGGKMPRTLASYVLGADDNNFSRAKGAHGYVALIFTPSEGEPSKEKGFTALVAVSASLIVERLAKGKRKRTPKEESLHLMLVESAQLKLDTFIKSQSNKGMEILPANEAYEHLKSLYGEGLVHDFQNNKRSYLNKLYGFLRGRRSVSAAEAEQAARTFSKFMAYKPIDNINDFVKTEVLEPYNLSEDISRISALMRNVYDLREEAERLKKNIEFLEQAKVFGETVRQSWFDRKEQALCGAYKNIYDLQRNIEANQDRIKACDNEEQHIRTEVHDINKQLEHIDQERITIERMRQRFDAASEKDRLTSQINENRDRLNTLLQQVLKGLETARHNNEYIKQLLNTPQYILQKPSMTPAFEDILRKTQCLENNDLNQCMALTRMIAENANNPDPQHFQNLRDQLTGIDDCHNTIHAKLNDELGIRSLADQEFGSLQQQLKEKQQVRKDIQRKFTRLTEHGRIEYPAAVSMAIAAIEEQYPQAQPQVLSDLVEVRERSWQAAIEGYIGFNRYAIIVQPEYEARAIDLVKSLPRRGAQVIQGAKAMRDAARISVPAHSIVNELIVSHPVARAYLQAAYGSVAKVMDVEGLRTTPRGVTQQGHGSASYKLFICMLEDHELTFGEQAREEVKKHLSNLYAQSEIDIKDLDQYKSDLKKIHSICRAYRQFQMEQAADALSSVAKTVADFRSQLSRLDLSNIEELEGNLTALNKRRAEYESKKEKQQTRIGELHVTRDSLKKTTDELHESLLNMTTGLEVFKQDVAKLQRFEPDYDPEEVFTRMENESHSPAIRSSEQIDNRIQKSEDKANKSKKQFRKILIEEYNPQAKQVEQVGLRVDDLDDYSHTGSDFYAVIDAYTQVKEQLRRQHSIGLAEVTDRLANAQQSVNNAFTANFSQLIYDAIVRGEDRLNRLNDELDGHKFGDEHYRFAWDWVPEYKHYYEFFVHVMKMESLGEGEDLFQNAEIVGKLAKVRDEITQLLLSNDIELAQQRLQEIGDYRNYRRYEIYKDTGRGEPVALSEYGTGSGGQLETPAYVVRAAAVSAAFRLREGKQHLRMVMIDESFAKMDEQRAKAVLNYLNKTMNFQVCFIIPTKAAGAFQPILSNKFVFVKIASRKAKGELRTVIHVDAQTIHQQPTESLWQQHGEQVQRDVITRFDQDHNDEEDTGSNVA